MVPKEDQPDTRECCVQELRCEAEGKTVKTNKWILALVILTLSLPSNSVGFQGIPDDIKLTGNFHYSNAETLVRQCKAVENVDLDRKQVPLKDAMDVGTCLGFISGVVDLNTMDLDILKKPIHAWCVPDGVTATQLAKVVVKYGNDHPGELHFPGVIVVVSALVGAFPCGH
jgi:Rap1a immunity proteins